MHLTDTSFHLTDNPFQCAHYPKKSGCEYSRYKLYQEFIVLSSSQPLFAVVGDLYFIPLCVALCRWSGDQTAAYAGEPVGLRGMGTPTRQRQEKYCTFSYNFNLDETRFNLCFYFHTNQ